MSGSNGRSGRPPHKNSKEAPSVDGDELDTYTQAQLLRMDADFCAAVKHAIKRGLERSPDNEAPDRAA